MSQAQTEPTPGLVVVDKPAGMTSHDVVGRLRRLAGTRKVGHAGTLDPMATGVLVAGVGRATRLLTYIVGESKTYVATIRLGETTTTEDAEGEILERRYVAAVTRPQLDDAVAGLTGEIQQVPSAVSAIKVDGKRAYQRVRDGENVQLQARAVTVNRFDVLDVRRADDGTTMDVDVVVDCSSGTYVRALARDLGEALGVGGHLTALRRTRVGGFNLSQARTLEQLGQQFSVLSLANAARALFPVRHVSDQEAIELGHGRRITPSESAGVTAAIDPAGDLIALIENKAQGTHSMAKPALVFAPR
ncbi:tRNA pseudouridine(55) synthase TruB [Pseudoglutamicibacter albus]|uniref:tRNA pseudouridine(55) synthase TruB n=1 Tax=Pseudoglutamicibacter albus TaxID=98671 RepID=UPI001EF4A9DA|nr:tRNA pseudouridine(55) synthase TruB [Pseudoglutamicibacter albus]MCG7304553.1 tRNA pseudouridine(55) synthase TruB [Pseudoglutamicibacter albus]